MEPVSGVEPSGAGSTWTFGRALVLALWSYWLLQGVWSLHSAAWTIASQVTAGIDGSQLLGAGFLVLTLVLRVLLFVVASLGLVLALHQGSSTRWAGLALVAVIVVTELVRLTTQESRVGYDGPRGLFSTLLLLLLAVPLALPWAGTALRSTSIGDRSVPWPAMLGTLSAVVLAVVGIGLWVVQFRTGQPGIGSSFETLRVTFEWIRFGVDAFVAIGVVLLLWRSAPLGWAAFVAWMGHQAIFNMLTTWTLIDMIQRFGASALGPWVVVYPVLLGLTVGGLVLAFLPRLRASMGIRGDWKTVPDGPGLERSVPLDDVVEPDGPPSGKPFRIADRER